MSWNLDLKFSDPIVVLQVSPAQPSQPNPAQPSPAQPAGVQLQQQQQWGKTLDNFENFIPTTKCLQKFLLPRDLTDLCVQSRVSQKVDNVEMMSPCRHLVASQLIFPPDSKGYCETKEGWKLKLTQLVDCCVVCSCSDCPHGSAPTQGQ